MVSTEWNASYASAPLWRARVSGVGKASGAVAPRIAFQPVDEKILRQPQILSGLLAQPLANLAELHAGDAKDMGDRVRIEKSCSQRQHRSRTETMAGEIMRRRRLQRRKAKWQGRIHKRIDKDDLVGAGDLQSVIDGQLIIRENVEPWQTPRLDPRGKGRTQPIVATARITVADQLHPASRVRLSSTAPSASRISTCSGICPSACVAQDKHGS